MGTLVDLKRIRENSIADTTTGLPDDIVEQFLKIDSKLSVAIDMAAAEFKTILNENKDILKLSEKAQIAALQSDFVNFYSDDSLNPYVALAAHGPWVITSCGEVVYDAGGYGMLGLGHSPTVVLQAMNRPHVMANIMTASFAQKRFSTKILKEIGHRRSGEKRKPFAKLLCLNSGSEAMTVAARISDINAANLCKPTGRHAGKKIKFLAFKGGFHGRTDRPAQVSDSSIQKYKETLASFRSLDNLVTISPNNIDELKAAFAKAKTDGVFFEAFFVEPVMGEGNPGLALSPEFFKLARELTRAEGTLLICDSIQASIRAHGCLSVTDYPGFENMDGPDMETYSKALNAGQYPLSVLAMTADTAALYVKGVYGNTMTTNPRALDVASAVLDTLTPELRKNISDRGQEFVQELKKLQSEFPDIIEDVKGTGLLVAAAINPAKFKVVGVDCLEEKMRKRGVGVIHGGKNALRFTPHFAMTSGEIKLVVNVLRDSIKAS